MARIDSMLETPKVVVLQSQATAKIYQVVPRSQIQNAMVSALQEIKSVLQAQGVEPTGSWFTHHLRAPGEDFDFEVCFPVGNVVSASGRVKPGEWPAMTVARTVYRGGYEGLGAAWGEFIRWLEAEGHCVTAELWERYLRGPESGMASSEWQTELSRCLI